MTAYRFLEPLDVLFLRGNKLFGDPGSYGESLVPPWPSVAAGAIRSRMMAEAGIDFAAFRDGAEATPELGSLEQPGPFRVTGFWLARRYTDGRVETLHPLPADLVATQCDNGLQLHRLQPVAPAPGLESSAALPKVATLATNTQAKPATGLWLTESGWRAYLEGRLPAADQLIEPGRLWSTDLRVGVGLDPAERRADEGKLFSMQAVALQPGLGFVAAVTGAEAPAAGLVRLGGDGRGAAIHKVEAAPPLPDLDAICDARRCLIVLTSPGLFPDGWRLPGCDDEQRFALGGVTGRLVCAAVPRAETVSGWDLARWQPKSAQRAAPAGSVYWLEELEATSQLLDKLAENGLWPEQGYDAQRRAEGFNRFTFAIY